MSEAIEEWGAMSKQPPPSAVEAAGVLLNKLDADHITEVRPASWALAVNLIQEHMTRFAERVCEQRVSAALAAEKFRVHQERQKWLGDPRKRLHIPPADWGPPQNAPAERPAPEPTWTRTSACNIQGDGFCTTHQTANMAECANAEMRPAPEGLPRWEDTQDFEDATLSAFDRGSMEELSRRPLVQQMTPIEDPADPQPETTAARKIIADAVQAACVDPDSEDAQLRVIEPFLEAGISAALRPPAAVVDYTERARDLCNEIGWAANAGRKTIAAVAAALSAIASEHQAEADRLRKDVEWLAEERAQAIEAKAALLARLQDPDVREAVINAMREAPAEYLPGRSRFGATTESLADAALTKITEILGKGEQE